jgi:hypothetical protein
MKSILLLSFILSFQFSSGQSFSAPSLNVDIHNLYNAYLLDFKNIWGKKKNSNESEIVYYSNYKVTGAVDSTNLVIYNKAERTFAFTAVMDTKYVTTSALNDAFSKVRLAVGILKVVETNIASITTYILADKKTIPFKSKKLTILVSNNANLMSEDKERQFSFKIFPVPANEKK